MTTWAGMGTNGNAGPVARLQAELEAVEGELVLAQAEIARLRGQAEPSDAQTMRAAVVEAVREWAEPDDEGFTLARRELDILAAVGLEPVRCPNGCGCRRGTNDPEMQDCACDGPCCFDGCWGELPDLTESDAALAMHIAGVRDFIAGPAAVSGGL